MTMTVTAQKLSSPAAMNDKGRNGLKREKWFFFFSYETVYFGKSPKSYTYDVFPSLLEFI